MIHAADVLALYPARVKLCTAMGATPTHEIGLAGLAAIESEVLAHDAKAPGRVWLDAVRWCHRMPELPQQPAHIGAQRRLRQAREFVGAVIHAAALPIPILDIECDF